jgi:hypothetical protein
MSDSPPFHNGLNSPEIPQLLHSDRFTRIQNLHSEYKIFIPDPNLRYLNLKTGINHCDPYPAIKPDWCIPKSQLNVNGNHECIKTWIEAAGINEEFFDHILKFTTERQKKRLNSILIGEREPGRGRKPELYEIGKQNNRNQYIKQQGKNISKIDIKNFFSSVIIMGIRKFDARKDYFNMNEITLGPQGCGFVHVRLSKKRFNLLMQLLDYDIEWMCNFFSTQTKNFYVPTINISSDETMCPTKSHFNPHHMYVPGKPHPNGCLSTSCGDENYVLLSIKLRRRFEIDYDPIIWKSKDKFKPKRN